MATALGALRRMLTGGGSHPLVVLAILHRHYRQLLRLDGSGATGPEEAAELLGLRSSFPARKGPGPVPAAGIGPHRAGRQAAGRGRPGLRGTSGLPEESSSRSWWPG